MSPLKNQWSGWGWSVEDWSEYDSTLERMRKAKEDDVKLYKGKKYMVKLRGDVKPEESGVWSSYCESLGGIAEKMERFEDTHPGKDGGTAFGHKWMSASDVLPRPYKYAIVRVVEEENEFGVVIP